MAGGLQCPDLQQQACCQSQDSQPRAIWLPRHSCQREGAVNAAMLGWQPGISGRSESLFLCVPPALDVPKAAFGFRHLLKKDGLTLSQEAQQALGPPSLVINE